MDQPRMINIQEARRSQSGKTLGIKDSDGQWYQTKHWELDGMVGSVIYAQVSASEFNGKVMYWINDFTGPDNQPGGQGPSGPPPLQAPPPIQTPVQHPQGTISAQPTQIDRDASIVAQALVKACQPGTIEKAFEDWRFAYEKYLNYRDGCADEPVPAPQPGQHDDIPF